ncbi:MAG: hypothetical protein AAF500_10420 [Myxococcota bacterium]
MDATTVILALACRLIDKVAPSLVKRLTERPPEPSVEIRPDGSIKACGKDALDNSAVKARIRLAMPQPSKIGAMEATGVRAKALPLQGFVDEEAPTEPLKRPPLPLLPASCDHESQ